MVTAADGGGTLSGLSRYTLGAWIKPTATSTGGGIIASFFNGVTLPWVLGVSETGSIGVNGELFFGVFSGSWGFTRTFVQLSTYFGRWVHFAATCGDSTGRVYLDGKLMQASGVGNFAASRDVYVGKRWDGTSPFNGEIADAFVARDIWSQSEIMRLAQGYSPNEVRPGSLAAYWPFADPNGLDATGKVTLTAVGAPTHTPSPFGLVPPSAILTHDVSQVPTMTGTMIYLPVARA